jgi:dual oxidase
MAQQYLTDTEINRLIDDLDHDGNGYVDYWELERKLDEVHREIAPKPQPHQLHHSSRGDEARHHFLRNVIGTNEDRIKRDEFTSP